MLNAGRILSIFRLIYSKYAAYVKARRIRQFMLSGREPWSLGYNEYKWNYISAAINDSRLLERFCLNQKLPPGFGVRIDERIIEYPWVISRLSDDASRLLDAGSTLNFPMIITQPKICNKDVTIFTFAPETNCFWQKRISYQFGDLRNLPFTDEWFDEIACISTLEHIGMDNRKYASCAQNELNVFDFKLAVSELCRVLKSGGKMFITLPFGKYQKISWGDTIFAQQFDSILLGDLKNVLSRCEILVHFYQYSRDGWNISTEKSCSDVEYFNIHIANSFNDDFAAAARAVACLEVTKQ